MIGLVPPSLDGTLLAAVSACLARRGSPKSVSVLGAHMPPPGEGERNDVIGALDALGFRAAWVQAPVPADVLPAVAADGDVYRLVESVEQVGEGWDVLLVQPIATAAGDARTDALVDAQTEGWFWPVLWRYRRYFLEAASLSAVINVLTLAGILFMMTVYDRILPNQAYVTLWSLAVGVGIAMLFEFGSRTLRGNVLDAAGKKIDLVLGDALFARVLGARLEYRSQSSGAFANILKEFESVRAFVTSATLTTVADLPFGLLFLGVIAVIAGPLVFVPLVTFAIVAAISLAVQWPLAREANRNLKESAIRHGTVIESLEGIETLKALRAEARMRRRHEEASAVIAATAMKSQSLTNLVLNLTVALQQIGAEMLLVWGVYLTGDGVVSAGALIASVQLSSRALAPLLGLTNLAVRFQAARTAYRSLDKIMATPLEREPGRTYFSRDEWQGAIELKGVTFGYAADAPPALHDINIVIKPGEKIAILGRMGSGKSTLLRLLASLYRPQAGQVFLDGVDMQAIEPADVRGAIRLVGQDARLFHGSLAENLRLAAPGTSDADVLDAAKWSGVSDIAAAHPQGFERPVGERGDSLSGGQRQAVAIARAAVSKPKVMLLDEPTSAMDQRSEADVLNGLRECTAGATIVVVTHKLSILPLVDRVILLDKGRVVADGPRDTVMKAIGEGRIRAVGA